MPAGVTIFLPLSDSNRSNDSLRLKCFERVLWCCWRSMLEVVFCLCALFIATSERQAQQGCINEIST